ncbi:MAG TPA: hypothetical protein VFS43_16710 [Polyangiaceae bacterium]|nr:hypothetical protein [Polyangiaceae bacterium]
MTRRPNGRTCAPLLLAAALAACGDDDGGAGDAGAGGQGGQGGEGGVVTIERPNRFRVRLDDDAAPSVVLKLDKAKALEVFGESGAKKITILEVDTTPLLKNAIAQIQDACGTGWRLNAANPNHNCEQGNDLGKSFGPNWRTTPEFALVRLLTMTPANANVTGTSLADFKKLIDGNPGTFAFTFAEVLAESMDIGLTDPFVPTDQLIAALQRQLFAGHPAISDPTGVRMAVSLYDALNDLTPLATKLGPVGAKPWAGAGEHPGVLVPDDATFTTKSNVMLPEFEMRVVAESGLRRVAGVDLSKGGGDMYVRTADAPLRFDFNDPEKLQISGLAPTPTIDMRFAMREFQSVVPSCTDVPACKSNYPPPMGTPVGTNTVWTLRPFLLEQVVARAAMITYGERAFTKCYFQFDGCQTSVNIGQGTDPPGWAVFYNNISFGGQPPLAVPAPQFLWELLTEVAQVAVHDPAGDGSGAGAPAANNIAEGAAEPVYALRGVGIGLTADQILADLRPTLQGQAGDIADIILGRYWRNNDALDFYYAREAPGAEPYLYFVAEDDLRPADQASDEPRPYRYQRPGFFSDPGLGDGAKVSTKMASGVADIAHEKYRLPRGPSTLYMQDDDGATYRVDFYVPEDGDPVEISAEVTRL